MIKEKSTQEMIMNNTFVSILNIFKDTDNSSIQVIADFDRTLTYAFDDEEKFVASLLSIVRDYGYLSENYSIKAKELFNKYHPIEQSHELSVEEKIPYMLKWWQGQFNLLQEEKLNLKQLDSVAKSNKIKFREFVHETFEFLHNHNIPIIIFSASGIGVELIQRVLENRNLLFENVSIISNEFEWDEQGTFIKAKEPFLHSLNKNEGFIKNKPKIYDIIKDRENVILIGDSISDVHMVDGFKYENLLKLGFLNFEYKKNVEKFKSNFDCVLLNDQSFKEVKEIVEKIL